MNEAKVSTIIANYNGSAHLQICLPSLLNQTFKRLEIIVVDNCSSDDSEVIAKYFGVRWVGLRNNLGLAPALNIGAAAAAGDFLLFINNDMRFDPGFVAALYEPFGRSDKLFATDGMQLNWEKNTVEHAATRLTRVRHGSGKATELVPGLFFFQKQVPSQSNVFMASAACMMVRRTLFREVGGFDDRLPLGYEDVEICWRAWLRGYCTLFVPQAICWHRVGGSQRSWTGARLSFRGVVKGRLVLATKLLPVSFAVRTWAVSVAGFARDLLRLRWRYSLLRICVFLETLGILHQLLKERRELFRLANRSPSEQLSDLLQLTSQDHEIE